MNKTDKTLHSLSLQFRRKSKEGPENGENRLRSVTHARKANRVHGGRGSGPGVWSGDFLRRGHSNPESTEGKTPVVEQGILRSISSHTACFMKKIQRFFPCFLLVAISSNTFPTGAKWTLKNKPQDLHVRTKTIKLLEDNIGINLSDFGLKTGFLDLIPKAQAKKKKKK